jgi:hypothetical protein
MSIGRILLEATLRKARRSSGRNWDGTDRMSNTGRDAMSLKAYCRTPSPRPVRPNISSVRYVSEQFSRAPISSDAERFDRSRISP